MQWQYTHGETYLETETVLAIKYFYLTIMLIQGSFTSLMEWVQFKGLFWNTNDSIANLTISFTSGVSLLGTP